MQYEELLLGGLIKLPTLIADTCVSLKPQDFTTKECSTIYQTMLSIYTDKGYFDYFTVEDKLTGDPTTIKMLQTVALQGEEFDKTQLNFYIDKIIEAKKILRTRILGATLSDTEMYKKSDIDSIISNSVRDLFEISKRDTVTEQSPTTIIDKMKKEMEINKGKKLWGYTTGFNRIDFITHGMQAGQLWVIGAYTSTGKSWLSLALANSAHKHNAKVLYISTEMTEQRIAWRLIVLNTGIEEYRMIRGELSLEEQEKRDKAIEGLKGDGFTIVSGLTKIDEVLYYIRKELAKKDGCDVVFVDFLQNLATGKDEYEDLSNAIRKLQTLALTENICIVVASQISRESNKAGASGGFGYKGSGTIEACADIGILMYKDPDVENRLMVDMRKNRNGLTGIMKIDVDFATGKMLEERTK